MVGTSAEVFIWDPGGKKRLKGHNRPKGFFKDYEVGANCFVLLIVRCLWAGEVFNVMLVAKAVAFDPHPPLTMDVGLLNF